MNLEQCKKAEILESDSEDVICTAGVEPGFGNVMLTVPNTVMILEQIYRVKFYHPSKGLITCQCLLSNPMDMGDTLAVQCDVIEQLEQVQRRLDVKVQTNIRVMVHVERRPGDLYIPLTGWPAVIRNISAGGVYFSTDLSLNVAREIEFEFSETGEKIELTARILRVEDLSEKHNQTMYGYGCKFMCLSAKAENVLRNYVFKEERRQRSYDSGE
ncbi:MAG: PilZ domain-containing protein [Oscillospiraceae bacterium]|nr:PilZ domain-containing protein [Oscillospiraceae bacterium]